MALAFGLQQAGLTPDSLETTATVSLDEGTITSSKLVLKAKIPGIDNAKFQELAKGAEQNCPISKLLKTEITLDATLL
jgi:osmotically inducible protein OsmC